MPNVTKIRRGELGKKKPKSSGLSLPDEMNIPPSELWESFILIFGRKGIGKTTLANQFPNPFTLMFERGRRNLSIYQRPQKGEGPLTWEQVKEYCELFCNDDRFETLVVDTVDGAYECCFKYICEKNDVENPGESDEGPRIWDEIAMEFAALFNVVQDSGKCVVFTSHEKTRKLVISKKGLKRDEVDEIGGDLERIEPTCKPAALKYMDQVCDFFFYYGYREGKRTITVRSPYNIHYTSGGIADKFLDPDGTPIECFVIGSSPEQAFSDLVSAYNNELYDIDYLPPAKERVTTRKKRKFKKRT